MALTVARINRVLALTVAALLLLIAPSMAKDFKPGSAGEVADRFYRTYLKLNPRGLPSDVEMAELTPLFSADLVELFAAAKAEQEKDRRERPAEKPVYADGNMFASNYEGVTSYKLGEPVLQNEWASLPVYLEWREKGTGQTARWIDVIVLQRANKEWRVWDIFMNAPWPFRSGPSLRGMLPPKE